MSGDALFVVRGDSIVPTDLARGPWREDALHGGAVGALVIWAFEGRERSLMPNRLVRVVVDLLRPVPIRPLTLELEPVRYGRSVEVVDLTVRAGECLMARASATWMCSSDLVLPETPATGAKQQLLPPPRSGLKHVDRSLWSGFHSHGMDVRHVEHRERAEGAAWVRMLLPVVQGSPPSPAQRAIAAAELASGIGASLPPDRYRAINTDLAVWMWKMPEGEWVGLSSRTFLGSDGTGIAAGDLYDRSGRIGHMVQTLVIGQLG